MTEEGSRLIGIKAIAGYLDMSVRNVYYWEKKLGLPLHRVSGHSGYRIYAFKEEIDRWLKDKDEKALKVPKYKKLFLPIRILTFIVIVVLLTFLFIKPVKNSSTEFSFTVDKNIIYVKNPKGDILWSINHGHVIKQRDLGIILDVENIDNDPQKEVIACIRDLLNKDKNSITLFDHDGRVIWKRMMKPKHRFSKIEINNFFRPGPSKFARTKPNELLIITKWVHMERFLSIITSHNLEGELVDQYFHTGNLTSTMQLIDVNKDGEVEIVFTGTNNLLNHEGILGVLPLKNFNGINPPYRVEPEYIDEKYRLKKYLADEIVRGNQSVYLRFKKTPHLAEYESYINNTEIAYFSDNLIQVRLFPWLIEPEDLLCGFDYIFTMDFTLQQVIIPPLLGKIYPRLLNEKNIDIPLDELKKIYSKIVYRWVDDHWEPITCVMPE